MYHQWLWVAALIGIASALPMQSQMKPEQLMKIFQSEELGRNNAIESIIFDVLEDLRELMVAGSDDIPVLDPLHIGDIFVDDSILPIPGAQIEINDLVVSKLSTFDVQEVSVESTNIILQRYRVQIQGEIPVIDVVANHYDLLLRIMGLDVFGKGDAKISVIKPWLRINTNVNIRMGWLAVYLNIMDLRLDVGLDDIQFNISGMFNDPSVDDFINRFLRYLVLDLAEFYLLNQTPDTGKYILQILKRTTYTRSLQVI